MYLRPGPLGLQQRQGGQHACLHLLVQPHKQVKGQMQRREVKGPLQAWKQGKGQHPPLPSSSPADIMSQYRGNYRLDAHLHEMHVQRNRQA